MQGEIPDKFGLKFEQGISVAEFSFFVFVSDFSSFLSLYFFYLVFSVFLLRCRRKLFSEKNQNPEEQPTEMFLVQQV